MAKRADRPRLISGVATGGLGAPSEIAGLPEHPVSPSWFHHRRTDRSFSFVSAPRSCLAGSVEALAPSGQTTVWRPGGLRRTERKGVHGTKLRTGKDRSNGQGIEG